VKYTLALNLKTAFEYAIDIERRRPRTVAPVKFVAISAARFASRHRLLATYGLQMRSSRTLMRSSLGHRFVVALPFSRCGAVISQSVLLQRRRRAGSKHLFVWLYRWFHSHRRDEPCNGFRPAHTMRGAGVPRDMRTPDLLRPLTQQHTPYMAAPSDACNNLTFRKPQGAPKLAPLA